MRNNPKLFQWFHGSCSLYNPFQLLCNASTWVPVSTTVHFWRFCIKDAKSWASALSAVGVWDLSVRATLKSTNGFWVLRNQILLHALISMIFISYIILFTKVINEKNITLCTDLPIYPIYPFTPLRISKKYLSMLRHFWTSKILSWAIRKVLSG